MRVSMEPLLYQAGVDVVFYGHGESKDVSPWLLNGDVRLLSWVPALWFLGTMGESYKLDINRIDTCFAAVHAYERSYPVYNYMVNSCGANHITIGDAGNTGEVYTGLL